MSSRIRVVAKHPDFGIFINRMALAAIETEFNLFRARYPLNAAILPAEFQGWPRWKRCAWKAQEIGWKFKAFREPRNTRISRSAFWKAAEKLGGRVPRRKTLAKNFKNINIPVDPIGLGEIRAAVRYLNARGQVIPPRQALRDPEAWPEEIIVVEGGPLRIRDA